MAIRAPARAITADEIRGYNHYNRFRARTDQSGFYNRRIGTATRAPGRQSTLRLTCLRVRWKIAVGHAGAAYAPVAQLDRAADF